MQHRNRVRCRLRAGREVSSQAEVEGGEEGETRLKERLLDGADCQFLPRFLHLVLFHLSV